MTSDLRLHDVHVTSSYRVALSGFGDYFAERNQVGSIVLVMIGLSLVAMVILVILENLDIYISRDRFGSRPHTPETVPCVDPEPEEKEERTVPNHDHVEQEQENADAEENEEIDENLEHDETTPITKISTGPAPTWY